MEALIRAVLPGWARADLEPHLPEWVDAAFWRDEEHLLDLAPSAQIGWFDMHVKPPALAAIAAARQLEWLSSAYAGVDWMPLGELAERDIALTCGSGLAAGQVAEFAVMSMLAYARGYRDIVRAQERKDWLKMPPRMDTLDGTSALILGYGEIGKAIASMLAPFGVNCTPVRSSAREGALGPDDWRPRLGEFDWVVLSLPNTPESAGMLGAAEFAAMKDSAVLVNYGRAEVVQQDALVTALQDKVIGGAILDLTEPEPLPPEHPLWDIESAHITMHLSGIPNEAGRKRASDRFLRNLELFRRGEPLEAQVDLERGY